ncbi:hypothetical protein ABPG74_019656 [Tetrahymena malaccensis]
MNYQQVLLWLTQFLKSKPFSKQIQILDKLLISIQSIIKYYKKNQQNKKAQKNQKLTPIKNQKSQSSQLAIKKSSIKIQKAQANIQFYQTFTLKETGFTQTFIINSSTLKQNQLNIIDIYIDQLQSRNKEYQRILPQTKV